MVQLSVGPVEGFVSQNYRSGQNLLLGIDKGTDDMPVFAEEDPKLCMSAFVHLIHGNQLTPGASKQHKSVSLVVLWHEAGPEVLQPELI